MTKKRAGALGAAAKAEVLEEQKLREAVRKLIMKEVAVSDTDPSPHRSTGINVLEDLLKKIIPVLEDDFKILTSNPEQRKSFRAHIINAAKNTIAPIKASDDAGKENQEEDLLEQDVEVKIGGDKTPEEDEAFIDIRTDQEKWHIAVIKRLRKTFLTPMSFSQMMRIKNYFMIILSQTLNYILINSKMN